MRQTLTTLALLTLPFPAAAAADGAALALLKLPQARIHSATHVAAGDLLGLWSGGQALGIPVPGSAISPHMSLDDHQTPRPHGLR